MIKRILIVLLVTLTLFPKIVQGISFDSFFEPIKQVLLNKKLTNTNSLTDYLLMNDSNFSKKYNDRPLAPYTPNHSLSKKEFLKFEFEAFRNKRKIIWLIDINTWKSIEPIYTSILKPMNVNVLKCNNSIMLYHPEGRMNALLLVKHSSSIAKIPQIHINKNNIEYNPKKNISSIIVENNGVKEQLLRIQNTNDNRRSEFTNNGRSVLTGILLNYDNQSIKYFYERNNLPNFEEDKQLAQDWIATQWKWIEYINKPGLRLVDKKYGWSYPTDRNLKNNLYSIFEGIK